MKYFETSAKKGTGVDEAFKCIAAEVVARISRDTGAGRGAKAAGKPAGGAGADPGDGKVVVGAAESGRKSGGCCGGGAAKE